MVTLDDIAREVGVSKVTVSNALRGRKNVSKTTAARILQTARAMHYRAGTRGLAARSLKHSAGEGHGVIGVAVPSMCAPWNGGLADAIDQEARRRYYETVFEIVRPGGAAGKTAEDASDHDRDTARHLMERYYDGLVLVANGFSTAQTASLVSCRPTVLIDDMRPQRDADTVLTDGERGGEMGVEFLVSRGCRHVLVIGTEPDGEHHADNGIARARERGCRKALDRLGLPYAPRDFVGAMWSGAAGRTTMLGMADSIHDYDAVLCLDALLTPGVMRALADLGIRVPDDASVLTFGGADGDLSVPTLSTIDLNVRKVAATAMSLLDDRLRDEASWMPKTVTVPATIRVRESA